MTENNHRAAAESLLPAILANLRSHPQEVEHVEKFAWVAQMERTGLKQQQALHGWLPGMGLETPDRSAVHFGGPFVCLLGILPGGDFRSPLGGFGIGNGSDFVWSASALVGYDLTPNVALAVGYHVLDYDFDTGRGIKAFKLDAQLRGPVLAVRILF